MDLPDLTWQPQQPYTYLSSWRSSRPTHWHVQQISNEIDWHLYFPGDLLWFPTAALECHNPKTALSKVWRVLFEASAVRILENVEGIQVPFLSPAYQAQLDTRRRICYADNLHINIFVIAMAHKRIVPKAYKRWQTAPPRNEKWISQHIPPQVLGISIWGNSKRLFSYFILLLSPEPNGLMYSPQRGAPAHKLQIKTRQTITRMRHVYLLWKRLKCFTNVQKQTVNH